CLRGGPRKRGVGHWFPPSHIGQSPISEHDTARASLLSMHASLTLATLGMAVRESATMTAKSAIALPLMLAFGVGTTPPFSQPTDNFYAGKTISMIVSTGPGGGMTANARLLAKHLSRHIAGNPTIVVRNMPGAGHVLANNYIATEAARDGTTIATTLPAIMTH